MWGLIWDPKCLTFSLYKQDFDGSNLVLHNIRNKNKTPKKNENTKSWERVKDTIPLFCAKPDVMTIYKHWTEEMNSSNNWSYCNY